MKKKWNENKEIEEIDIDDYPIGWPNDVTPPPMEYNLGLINKYLNEHNKSFDELTDEEKEKFKHHHHTRFKPMR